MDHYTYALLTKREVKMAGHWPSSFLCFYGPRRNAKSIKNANKKEANIQSSWGNEVDITSAVFFFHVHCTMVCIPSIYN